MNKVATLGKNNKPARYLRPHEADGHTEAMSLWNFMGFYFGEEVPGVTDLFSGKSIDEVIANLKKIKNKFKTKDVIFGHFEVDYAVYDTYVVLEDKVK